MSFTCSAASSSDSPMTFAWKKDNELLQDAEMENYAHLRAQGGEVMEYTTILRLHGVEFASEGRYQCVISNHFGSSYSVKAKLTVNSTRSPFLQCLGIPFRNSCSVCLFPLPPSLPATPAFLSHSFPPSDTKSLLFIICL